MILSWAALAFFLLPAPDFAPSSFFSFSENRFNILKLRSGTQAIESAPTHITLDSCNRSLLSNASALQIFCTGKNLGYGGGNNYGLQKVKTDYGMILNPDTIIN